MGTTELLYECFVGECRVYEEGVAAIGAERSARAVIGSRDERESKAVIVIVESKNACIVVARLEYALAQLKLHLFARA